MSHHYRGRGNYHGRPPRGRYSPNQSRRGRSPSRHGAGRSWSPSPHANRPAGGVMVLEEGASAKAARIAGLKAELAALQGNASEHGDQPSSGGVWEARANETRRAGLTAYKRECASFAEFDDGMKQEKVVLREMSSGSFGEDGVATYHVRRMLVVGIVAHFEGLLKGLLSESFEHVVNMSKQGDAKAEAFVEQALVRRMKFVQQSIRRSAESDPEESVARHSVKVARHWGQHHAKFLGDWKESIVRPLETAILGDWGIVDAVAQLHGGERGTQAYKEMHERIMEQLNVISVSGNLFVGTGKHTSRELTFKWNSADVCHTIVQMMYGLRCVFSHGRAEDTLKSGALRNFPTDADDPRIDIGCREQSEYYVTVIAKLRRFQREMRLNHYFIENGHTLVRFIGHVVTKSVGLALAQHYGFAFWGVEPHFDFSDGARNTDKTDDQVTTERS